MKLEATARDHGTEALRARHALAAILLGSAFCFVLPGLALADPCEVVDDGTGTVTLPPAGCDYLTPDQVHVIIDGLPPGTTIELAPIHKDFLCDIGYVNCSTPIPPGTCEAPGGALGGRVDCFDSTVQFQVTGTGLLAGFNRLLNMSAETEVHTAPRSPGDAVQDFDTDMFRLQSDLFGDPDFDFLQIRSGNAFGLPSPGHTTLTRLGPPGSGFNVDSFFDITYEITFQGAPGSILEGMAGTTAGTTKMVAGIPFGSNPCEVVDNGSGTVTLPPEGCEYLSPDEVHMILDGLPPGTTVELAAIHKDFICNRQGLPPVQCSAVLGPIDCEGAGGGLGGNLDCFDSVAELAISGTGALSSFQRTLFLPLNVEVHTGPRTPGDAVQSFPSEMVRLDGQLFGDPDFDLLRIRAGSDFGLPSPGHTTLTRLGPPGSSFQVDSFFDITYRIEFQGAPGGQLDGLSGITTGTIQMSTGTPPAGVPGVSAPLWILLAALGLGVSAVVVLRRRELAA